jgi:DNA-binding NtrC family response regulator
VVAVNSKVLARAREMQKVLLRIEPTLTGNRLRAQVRAALDDAEKHVPKVHRLGRQVTFTERDVRRVVKECNGNKVEAARRLNCSLRTVYHVLNRRDEPKPKPKAKPKQRVNAEAVTATAQALRAALLMVIPVIKGHLLEAARKASEKADRDISGGRQPKFHRRAVEDAVKRNGGDKAAAAAELGCSVRTVYAALKG